MFMFFLRASRGQCRARDAGGASATQTRLPPRAAAAHLPCAPLYLASATLATDSTERTLRLIAEGRPLKRHAFLENVNVSLKNPTCRNANCIIALAH